MNLVEEVSHPPARVSAALDDELELSSEQRCLTSVATGCSSSGCFRIRDTRVGGSLLPIEGILGLAAGC